MSVTGPNAGEAEYWSTSGQSWIRHEAVQDAILAPVTETLLTLADLSPGARVLDIGCGTGAHALAVADRVAPTGRVLALDVSGPFLDRTAARAKEANLPVQTRLGDAQVADWSGTFDHATSRFGVMFFADPGAAFANIARALKPGAEMLFAAWAPVKVNPWWHLPMAAASARLGALPPTPPHAPGPMGLADAEYAKAHLDRGGLRDVAVTPKTITLGPLGNAAEMAALGLKIGPAARAMRLFNGTESDAAAIADALTKAYAAYEDGGLVRIPATLNLIRARVA